MPGAVSKLLLSKSLLHLSETISNNRSTIALLHRFSSIHDRPMREFEPGLGDDCREDERRNKTHLNPPNPIPNRPLRGEKRSNPSEDLFPRKFKLENDDDDGKLKNPQQIPPAQFQSRRKRDDQSTNDIFTRKFDLSDNTDDEEKMKKPRLPNPVQFLNRPMDDQLEDSFLEKFKLGDDKRENPHQSTPTQISATEAKAAPSESPPQDADEIFKKMKETGLIPNAVAMLDGLCKDGLVQEAMKLFGLMREKGTIPEVVIYTAVVEGFCKAQKLEDAIRIFRKMQNNGITPNAFSYTVLIRGLYKGQRLEDATDFCVEMLEAGHSPNVATFAGLVDGFCRDRGMEEAQSIIGRLREKGFFVDEKAVREHLDKKGPFSSPVWEAIFGKKSSQRPF